MADETAPSEPVIVNLEKLADLMQVTAPTVKGYIKSGMPVLEGGSNGVSYKFDARACVAWRRGDLERAAADEERQRANLAQLQLELTGGQNGESAPPAGLTAKDRIEAVTAAMKEDQLRASRLQLATREDYESDIMAMFGAIRLEAMGLPQLLRRELGLSDEQTRGTERLVKDMLRRLAGHARDPNLTERMQASIPEADAA